ncbi:MAG: S9 family peptidase [Verrucomicrobiales bacterium]|nr:S9 family peptidase [Verrucomicrobiales bacterium]
MKPPLRLLSWLFVCHASKLLAQIPENLVSENIPPIPAAVRADASRYLEFRAAAFQSWHPQRREMLISTRFADTPQLHLVAMAGGARRQLTFLSEPVGGGSFRPKTGEFIVFSQDVGGGEFHQLYRYDLADGRISLLTDGKSRNTGARWSKSGRWLAYTSTRRNGRDNDIYVINPAQPETDRLLTEVSGGGWTIQDWFEDDSRQIIGEYISINESYLYLADAQSGAKELLTPKSGTKVSYGQARFAKDGQSIFVTTDRDCEFQRLGRIELPSRRFTPLTSDIRWDVNEFELSADGKLLAFVTNEDGVSVLHVLDVKRGKELRVPQMPFGVIFGLEWHQNGRDLGFNLSSAKSPTDAYSFDLRSAKLERWTQSETGGLNPELFVEPELAKMKSFDGLQISAHVYRPDPSKFPGKRPVLINIHGGPEAQSRPVFQARNNYYLNELGIAIVYPNVRGSAGYGKGFLTLDNGFKREDSVKDIGTVIDWVKRDARFDAERIAVIGGSYGGFMVLASLVQYSDQLRAGVDVVGISNFLTFLKNTQDYRRDLRRAEYGDERDPEMRDFLERISPANNVGKISKPLFVVQGKNDPRVPLSESEQMVRAIRDHGGKVWYLMAKDEGHGFAKKKNADFQFLATILFLEENLLK